MDMNKLVLILLLCLQGISTGFLWTLNATDVVSEVKFSVFLALNLLAFAMVAYCYRKMKHEQIPERVWMLIGSLGLVVLLFSGLFLP